jgi:hypothetical protein
MIMPRRFWMLRVTVKEGERGLLSRNGRFRRVLEPGNYSWFDPRRRINADVFATAKAEFSLDRYKALKATHPEVAARLFAVIETGPNEIAVINFDGRPTHLFGPSRTRVYWKITSRIGVERIDLTVDPKIVERHIRMMWRMKEIEEIERLVEKAGPALGVLLTRLVRLNDREVASEPARWQTIPSIEAPPMDGLWPALPTPAEDEILRTPVKQPE